jgi:hypothetical protein
VKAGCAVTLQPARPSIPEFVPAGRVIDFQPFWRLSTLIYLYIPMCYELISNSMRGPEPGSSPARGSASISASYARDMATPHQFNHGIMLDWGVES